MNKKGQALVEFVIILPIFVFMLLAVIDFGKMIYFKNLLQSEMSDVVHLYQNEKTYQEIMDDLSLSDENIELEIQNENNELVTFYLKREITIVTPGLSFLFPTPYKVEVSRVMHYE